MITRRNILKLLGTLPAAGYLTTNHVWAETATERLPKRLLGRTGRWVTPLALGGQASLQWTAPGIDAPDIIVRAVQLGLNYLDSANLYGPSQMNYGEAFRRIHLAPGAPDYNAPLRESLYIATKTRERFALGPSSPAATSPGATAVTDIKRSLTQMFGDGKGYIPEDAYLDAIQMHAISTMEDVDQLYLGMAERGSKMPDRIGAFPALLDYRDGTNYTGLNPEHKHYVRHVGATGHLSSPVLMEMLRRDTGNNLDTLLVALNANDTLYTSHQFNVLQLAVGRGMGVIAMKLFGDGTFYGKDPHFSKVPADVCPDGRQAQCRPVSGSCPLFPLHSGGVVRRNGHRNDRSGKAGKRSAGIQSGGRDPGSRLARRAAAHRARDGATLWSYHQLLPAPGVRCDPAYRG